MRKLVHELVEERIYHHYAHSESVSGYGENDIHELAVVTFISQIEHSLQLIINRWQHTKRGGASFPVLHGICCFADGIKSASGLAKREQREYNHLADCWEACPGFLFFSLL